MRSNKRLLQKKLELEIKALSKPWYKKAEYLRIIVPSIVALFSIIIIFFSGILDAKLEMLKVQKEKLQWSISKFEVEKLDLRKELYSLRFSADSLRREQKQLKDSILIFRNDHLRELFFADSIIKDLQSKSADVFMMMADYTTEDSLFRNSSLELDMGNTIDSMVRTLKVWNEIINKTSFIKK